MGRGGPVTGSTPSVHATSSRTGAGQADSVVADPRVTETAVDVDGVGAANQDVRFAVPCIRTAAG